jgi:hypothetical protein
MEAAKKRIEELVRVKWHMVVWAKQVEAGE